MAGYRGYSMSNNAIEAYSNGEKPLSKWRKCDIIEAIQNYVKEDYKFDIGLLNKISAENLKSEFLLMSSWHHTSKMYNKTCFYSLNEASIDELTNDRIEFLIDASKPKKKNTVKKEKDKEEKWECEFLVWSGSRKHPQASKETVIGTVRGGWFYLPNGRKKSVNANGFRMIRKVD